MTGYVRIEIEYAEARVIRDDAQDKAAALEADLEATMKIDDLEARRCAREVLVRKREFYKDLSDKMQDACEIFDFEGCDCDECASNKSD
ncbi:hypothetical protein [uncultured Actinomyces sp.]|uniref:hypothetical protein n=1 Tax=uncultured Actinomyces sp. TaxID=249061 RepID=UPI0028E509DD|nr:hypothetical protein [uncultured Actinomyces sp.]